MNDRGGGGVVGGTLQHGALNASRQVMLGALHSLKRAFILEERISGPWSLQPTFSPLSEIKG